MQTHPALNPPCSLLSSWNVSAHPAAQEALISGVAAALLWNDECNRILRTLDHTSVACHTAVGMLKNHLLLFIVRLPAPHWTNLIALPDTDAALRNQTNLQTSKRLHQLPMLSYERPQIWISAQRLPPPQKPGDQPIDQTQSNAQDRFPDPIRLFSPHLGRHPLKFCGDKYGQPRNPQGSIEKLRRGHGIPD